MLYSQFVNDQNHGGSSRLGTLMARPVEGPGVAVWFYLNKSLCTRRQIPIANENAIELGF